MPNRALLRKFVEPRTRIIALRDFIALYGQECAADILNCTQSNVSHILKSDRRELYITYLDDRYSYLEIIRPKGKGKKLAQIKI